MLSQTTRRCQALKVRTHNTSVGYGLPQPGLFAQCDTVHLLGCWLSWAPKKNLMQNFVFTLLFGHNLDPLDHWNHQNNFSNRVGKSTSICAIKLAFQHIYIQDLFKMLVMIICRISGYIKTVKAFHTISKELPATSVYHVLYNFDFYPLRIICLTNLLIIFQHMDALERL